MSARRKSASNRSQQASQKGSTGQARVHEEPRRILGMSMKAIAGIGVVCSTIVAAYGVYTIIDPTGSSSSPATPGVEASFDEAKLDPNILLEQYEMVNNPAALANVSVQATSGTRLAGYVVPAAGVEVAEVSEEEKIAQAEAEAKHRAEEEKHQEEEEKAQQLKATEEANQDEERERERSEAEYRSEVERMKREREREEREEAAKSGA